MAYDVRPIAFLPPPNRNDPALVINGHPYRARGLLHVLYRSAVLLPPSTVMTNPALFALLATHIPLGGPASATAIHLLVWFSPGTAIGHFHGVRSLQFPEDAGELVLCQTSHGRPLTVVDVEERFLSPALAKEFQEW